MPDTERPPFLLAPCEFPGLGSTLPCRCEGCGRSELRPGEVWQAWEVPAGWEQPGPCVALLRAGQGVRRLHRWRCPACQAGVRAAP